jgi:hypothetical protein
MKTRAHLSHLSKSEAKELFDDAYASITKWDSETTIIKKMLYVLLSSNADAVLEFKNKHDLVKSLAKGSKKHRSTLYDMANAVFIEIKLGLEHGAMSTDALITLKQGTDEADRYNIFLLAKQSCSENQDYPTKKMKEKAKLDYQNTIHDDLEDNEVEAPPVKKKKAKSKTKSEEQQLTEMDQLQDSDNGGQKQSNEEDAPSKDERIIKKILNSVKGKYNIQEQKILLDRLNPSNYKDIDAAMLLHYLGRARRLEVIKWLERITSI